MATTAERSANRTYYRQFFSGMALYVIAVGISEQLLGGLDNVWLRGLIALIPAPPLLLAISAVVRRIACMDELQRRIELEAIAVASLGIGLGTFALGLLEFAKVLPAVSIFYVLPAMSVIYGMAKCWATRRYR